MPDPIAKAQQAAKEAVKNVKAAGQIVPTDRESAWPAAMQWPQMAGGTLATTKLRWAQEADPDDFVAVVPIGPLGRDSLGSDEPNAGDIAIANFKDNTIKLYLDRPGTTVQYEMQGDPTQDGIRFIARNNGNSKLIRFMYLAKAAGKENLTNGGFGGMSSAISGANAFTIVDLKNVHPTKFARLYLTHDASEWSSTVNMGPKNGGVTLYINNGTPGEPVRVMVPAELLAKDLKSSPQTWNHNKEIPTVNFGPLMGDSTFQTICIALGTMN